MLNSVLDPLLKNSIQRLYLVNLLKISLDDGKQRRPTRQYKWHVRKV